ncbi:MAG: geranylgeranylglycerol-phosphate geranylgeranyltransferase [Paludibacteraceae bacterium]|nr:geranylgeranylglycerol-phosphate geranylgeranyltransferase [Paludibacteraceae bacterium]
MEQFKNYLRLVRINNLLFVTILLGVMQHWAVMPVLRHTLVTEHLPWWVLLLLVAGTVCVAAGGYVINDWFDVKIDRINRPDDLIVTRVIDKETAMRLFYVLTGVGIACGLASAVCCRSITLGAVFIIVPGLLWFYSASYKRQLFVGNLIVAFCAALTPMLVAVANVDYLRHVYGDLFMGTGIAPRLYAWCGGFAVFAFLMTWAREVVKDLQDRRGDRELECHTVPVVLGVAWAKTVVTVLLVLTGALASWVVWGMLPAAEGGLGVATRYLLCGLLIPLVCELWLLWAAGTPREYRNAQQLLKFIMLLGTLSAFFIVS